MQLIATLYRARAGLLQHPGAELAAQGGIGVNRRQEVGRAQQSVGRVLPPDESFLPDDGRARQLDDRVIEKTKLVVLDSYVKNIRLG